MAKIYKMNAGGTCGVSVTKSMKAAGYLAGVEVEWTAENGGFMLRIKKSADVPKEDPVVEAVSPL